MIVKFLSPNTVLFPGRHFAIAGISIIRGMVNFIRQKGEFEKKDMIPYRVICFLIMFSIGGVFIASARTPPSAKDTILSIKKTYCGIDLPEGTEIKETSPGCITEAKINSEVHFCNWRLPPGTVLNFGYDFFKSKQALLFKINSPSELKILNDLTLPGGTEIYLTSPCKVDSLSHPHGIDFGKYTLYGIVRIYPDGKPKEGMTKQGFLSGRKSRYLRFDETAKPKSGPQLTLKEKDGVRQFRHYEKTIQNNWNMLSIVLEVIVFSLAIMLLSKIWKKSDLEK